MDRKLLLQIAARYGTPVYVYDESMIQAKFLELKKALPAGTNIFYACKANSNPEILRILLKAGSSIECVSKEEVLLALSVGFKPEQLLYTCSSVSDKELHFIAKQGIKINLDSLGQLEKIGRWKPGSAVSLRINQGIGAGHHQHVITGGPDSKFGIYYTQVADILKMARKYRLEITGLHQHIGSNVLDAKILSQAATVLLKTAREFPDLESIDFGGGLGIPYKPDDKSLDVQSYSQQLAKLVQEFSKKLGRPIRIAVEPGRFLVAQAGVLLVSVTDMKKTPHKTFVGVNSGFNHLLRPAMYGAYHQIENISQPQAKKEKVTIVGNVCESGDIFGEGRMLSRAVEGSVLAILNAGAYGYAMSSNYNLRPRPPEVVVLGKHFRLTKFR